jgi:type II secretion system protein J
MTPNSRGFTLMETLLAVTLFAIVMTSSMGIFSMGLQIWKRSQGQALQERKVLLAMEKMGQAVREAVKIKVVPAAGLESDQELDFEGDNNSFSFPSVVTFSGKKGNLLTQYGKTTFRWDSKTRTLCRSLEGASDVYLKKKPECATLAQEIQTFKMRYWVYDGIGDSYSWYDSWEYKDSLPQAVSVSIDFVPRLKNGQVGLKKHYEKTFVIPVGGKP